MPKMFAFLTSIEIDFDDDYPKVACSPCFFKLEQAYHTRKEFVDNYTTLLSIVIAEPEACPVVEDVVREEVVMQEEPKKIGYKEEILSDVECCEIEELSFSELKRRRKSSTEDDILATEATKEVQVETSPVKKSTPRKRIRTKPKKPQKQIETIYEERKQQRKAWKMNPSKCYICNQVFGSPRELNGHLPQHSDMLPYTCQLCLKENGPQKDLIIGLKPLHQHIRQHSGCTPCTQCPFRVFGKEALYNHMQVYHQSEGQKFICEQCGFVLPNKIAHYGHMLRHKNVEAGRFRCETCDMKFGSNPRLQRHLLLHKEKEFQCQHCPKTFVSNTLLLTHERTHTGGQPSICATCGEKFSNSTKRWQHALEKHPEVVQANREAGHYNAKQTTPKSLVCEHEDCEYVAPNNQAFWYHVQTHELRFACEQCPKRFPTSQGLKNHKTVHTGEKAFECELCRKHYSQRVALRKHQETAHSGQV